MMKIALSASAVSVSMFVKPFVEKRKGAIRMIERNINDGDLCTCSNKQKDNKPATKHKTKTKNCNRERETPNLQ
jgi:hypothetical protein